MERIVKILKKKLLQKKYAGNLFKNQLLFNY